MRELNPFLLTEAEIEKRGGNIKVLGEWINANPDIVEEVKQEIAEKDEALYLTRGNKGGVA